MIDSGWSVQIQSVEFVLETVTCNMMQTPIPIVVIKCTKWLNQKDKQTKITL